jgi:hypothetical protein
MTALLPVWNTAEIKYNNHKCFPNHYRMLVVGESGGGKSVLVQRLLLTNLLDWDILYLYTPSILQASYQVLIKSINAGLSTSQILGLYAKQNEIKDYDKAIHYLSKALKLVPTRKVIASNNPEEMLKPEDLAKQAMQEWKLIGTINKKTHEHERPPKTIVVIDDAICGNQTAINKMFVYGRTYGINVVYLSQAFFATKKNETRTNVNVFILYRQSLTDTRMVYTRVCKDNKTFDDFYKFVDSCWKKERGFVLVVSSATGPTEYIDGEKLTKDIENVEKELYPLT